LDHSLDLTRGGGSWDYQVDLHAALSGDTDEGKRPERTSSYADLDNLSDLLDDDVVLEFDQSNRIQRTSPSRSESTSRKPRSTLSAAWKAVTKFLPKGRSPARG
jgi:hypothetical protein